MTQCSDCDTAVFELVKSVFQSSSHKQSIKEKEQGQKYSGHYIDSQKLEKG